MKITPGKYKHYKGHIYKVLGEGVHSESLEEMVIYESLYDDKEFPKGTRWIRPKKLFLEKVKHKGKTVPRFKKIK